jgi:hypothetical protein
MVVSKFTRDVVENSLRVIYRLPYQKMLRRDQCYQSKHSHAVSDIALRTSVVQSSKANLMNTTSPDEVQIAMLPR